MKTYMTRTCYSDMTSYGGFTWPVSGPVECPDWDPAPICGHGLHGLLLGCGKGDLLDWSSEAKWLLVEIDREDIVDLDGKVKVPRGTVIYSGAREEALTRLEALAPECLTMPVVGANRTAGYCGSATAGYKGSATAGMFGAAMAGTYGHALAGQYGTATAGYNGIAMAGYAGKATSENRGHATAGDWGTATTGQWGTAIAGHNGTAMTIEGGSATAGDWGSATAGRGGSATAGEGGRLYINWWDDKANRIRTIIGYVGENNIEPDKPYKVDPATGTLVLAG